MCRWKICSIFCFAKVIVKIQNNQYKSFLPGHDYRFYLHKKIDLAIFSGKSAPLPIARAATCFFADPDTSI